MILIYILLAVVLIPWLYGFYISNDLSVKNGDLTKYKNMLVVYPHPDDETLASGGIIRNFSDLQRDVTLIVLTRGEKGNDDAHLDNSLKKIREQELQSAAQTLGVKKIILEDFGDGELSKNKKEVQAYLQKQIVDIKPDLILTYDLAGLYGHADHIVTSEILTDLVIKKYPHIALIYAALPKKTLSMITLPEHMAKDPAYAKRRVTPTMKIWIGTNIYYRIRALYRYRSQLYSFRKSFPIPWIPLWYYYSMQVFEYYHNAHEPSHTPYMVQ